MRSGTTREMLSGQGSAHDAAAAAAADDDDDDCNGECDFEKTSAARKAR